jgi:hypothetical protein
VKEARGFVILGIAVLYRAARMVAGTPCASEIALDEAQGIVKAAEDRGLVSFEEPRK